jgi:2-dehydro-3-deoxyphosphooctonate aldolase (KDO 8-P synthase)
MSKKIKAGNVVVGDKPFVFIGGPCVIEDREITLRIADRLSFITNTLKIPFIFKASYDKANRTSIQSYRGPGIYEGLKILDEVKQTIGVAVLTDVHSIEEAKIASEIVDILQIPAFLSRQTDLLIACGETGKPINIKKGQFLSPHEIEHAVIKVESTGNTKVIITERGTCFGYNNLVNDFRSIPIMKGFGYPVVFDATHSVQRPGAMSISSGGMRSLYFRLPGLQLRWEWTVYSWRCMKIRQKRYVMARTQLRSTTSRTFCRY